MTQSLVFFNACCLNFLLRISRGSEKRTNSQQKVIEITTDEDSRSVVEVDSSSAAEGDGESQESEQVLPRRKLQQARPPPVVQISDSDSERSTSVAPFDRGGFGSESDGIDIGDLNELLNDNNDGDDSATTEDDGPRLTSRSQNAGDLTSRASARKHEQSRALPGTKGTEPIAIEILSSTQKSQDERDEPDNSNDDSQHVSVAKRRKGSPSTKKISQGLGDTENAVGDGDSGEETTQSSPAPNKILGNIRPQDLIPNLSQHSQPSQPQLSPSSPRSSQPFLQSPGADPTTTPLTRRRSRALQASQNDDDDFHSFESPFKRSQVSSPSREFNTRSPVCVTETPIKPSLDYPRFVGPPGSVDDILAFETPLSPRRPQQQPSETEEDFALEEFSFPLPPGMELSDEEESPEEEESEEEEDDETTDESGDETVVS